jgi:hypothetical protein
MKKKRMKWSCEGRRQMDLVGSVLILLFLILIIFLSNLIGLMKRETSGTSHAPRSNRSALP